MDSWISKTNILAKGQGSCTTFDYRRLFRTFSDILLTSAHPSSIFDNCHNFGWKQMSQSFCYACVWAIFYSVHFYPMKHILCTGRSLPRFIHLFANISPTPMLHVFFGQPVLLIVHQHQSLNSLKESVFFFDSPCSPVCLYFSICQRCYIILYHGFKVCSPCFLNFAHLLKVSQVVSY